MIYLGNISTCSEEALLPLVCAERRDYAAKYKQSADKIRSLGVAALLGIALKREGYIDALPVSLTHDEKQKPVLSDMVDITNNPKERADIPCTRTARCFRSKPRTKAACGTAFTAFSGACAA